MDQAITLGVDVAKHVFQVHGVDASGTIVVRRQLKRTDFLSFFRKLGPCLIGMEACGSAHYWARELSALGHDVRLIAPIAVKPYVKRGKKNDAVDAAAICEAVGRPHMRFVPIKSAEQQGILMLHRARDLLVRQRTSQIVALRGHLAEYGLIAGQGKGNFARLRTRLTAENEAFPPSARFALRALAEQIDDTDAKITALDKEILRLHQTGDVNKRLASIPGVGPIIASVVAATVPDASVFDSGRQFAAWLGLVPRQNSTGGKERLGHITKTGDRYIRRLLVIGATCLIRFKRQNIPGGLVWLTNGLAKKPVRLVSVALANKMARIVWAILRYGGTYRAVEPTLQHA